MALGFLAENSDKECRRFPSLVGASRTTLPLVASALLIQLQEVSRDKSHAASAELSVSPEERMKTLKTSYSF